MKNPKSIAYLLLWLAAATQAAADDDLAVKSPDPEGTDVPLAEQDLEADMQNVGPDSIRDPDEISLDLLNAEFRRVGILVVDRAYDEADSVAKRAIEMAIRLKGPRSAEMAKALTNLAIVQHYTAQYDAAGQNFQSAIEIIEDNEDRLNSQLVNPLKGLAASQLEGGRPDLASSTLQRAVHVTHVNDGPHNPGQVELLDSLTEVNVRMGLHEEANDLQDAIYALNVRHIANDSMELIPSLMKRALWQHRIGFINQERATYRRVIRIYESKFGKTALQLIRPLVLLGKSFSYLDMSGVQAFRETTLTGGEIYFKRAVRIAAEHPDTNWEMQTIATLALGDHYMHIGNTPRATQTYLGVWDLLSEDEARLDTRQEQLEINVVLKMQPLPQYIGNARPETAPSSGDPVLQGSISLIYDISVRGRASGVKLLEADPPEFLEIQKAAQRELRRRIFRPRFFEAKAATSTDQVFVHTFFYRMSDLEALRDDSSASDSDDS
ncbi:MAG: tetratricopeptide repeat protein [Woeseiaceae bacterium]|nr:tetratricopeptide repeat protein [Woeseiaceae bacterium]MDX2607326.1 tetratricopeptide repeat protein [Woeseiaceae bacterium]